MQPKELQEFLRGKTDSLRIFKSGPGTRALLARELVDRGENVVLVVPGARELKESRALLGMTLPGGEDPNAPAWEQGLAVLPPYPAARPRPEEWAERWAAMHSLVYGKRPMCLLMTVDNFMTRWPDPATLENCWLPLSKGDDLSPEMILEQAVSWGYTRTKMVSGPGQAALRGDILDIHAPGYPMPLRLEFFGDTLEDIRLFDGPSQRSKADLAEAMLLPVSPGIAADPHASAARKLWEEYRTRGEMGADDEKFLCEKLDQSDGNVWPGLFYPDAGGIEKLFPPKTTFILAEGGELRERIEDAERNWRGFLESEEREHGRRWPLSALCRTPESARGAWRDGRQLVFEELVIGTEKKGIDLPERSIGEFADIFWQPEHQRRPWQALMEGIKEWNRAGQTTVLGFRTDRSRNRFLSLAEPERIPFGLGFDPEKEGTSAVISGFRHGVEVEWSDIRLLGEGVLQPEAPKSHRARDKAFKGLTAYEDLSDGDLLVHRDYGLCRYGGLHHMKLGDVANDYLLLDFAGDDKLYLPVDRLKLVQRFKGPEGASPALDKLGGTRWKATTARVRKAIEKIAHELVEMYAYRRVTKGFSYGPLDEMYHDFEVGFGFEATPDQEKAIRDVFEDMEKPEPMDRLVCGDVGFGKTEVALRAAFRAAIEGHQVALLCPTTVLAEQHYQTFLRRMEDFPLRIGMLSRFVDRKRQKTVLEAAARGEIDILIGTHRLLSKDVEMPNLGLLILDEEQRFGVRHKERLKQFRNTIDVLTLTATPIPRTLQLSLSGLRGLSVIETPPEDRKPVKTGILTREKAELRGILQRELERGGQVFWVYNRVEGLERAAEYVRELVPDARIGMAHGKMTEKKLEETMHGFWHGELDVLVCTAIVESGLDFPNANTLIVDQAQMFGLGQLYQLRGRVGRSERQAYAYFVVPSLDDLQEKVRKRLRIILDLDYLGAGFKVAMEDLRLRGAGNILGETQSGQIARVGLDLFLEMLEEEVRRVRGEVSAKASEPELNFVFEAHIPSDYVPDSRERLRYYKALSGAANDAELTELEAELKDRFGSLPEQVDTFIGVLTLKQTLARLQAERAELYPGRAVISWEEGTGPFTPESLVAWASAREDRARLMPPARIELRYAEGDSVREALEAAAVELDALADERPNQTTETESK